MTELNLASLREAGAHQHDPVRFHYLEVLERRLAVQPEKVAQQLSQRLRLAVQQYAEGWALASSADNVAQAATPSLSTLPRAHAAPLTSLNHHIRQRSEWAFEPEHEQSVSVPPGHLMTTDRGSLRSFQRFGEIWGKVEAEQKLAKALDGGPENAGPLNSHRLMLRALHLMRGLSTDYLGCFLTQMDTLLWLDQVNQKSSLKESKARSETKSKRLKSGR